MTATEKLAPRLFMPHPNLADEINRNICQSEIEGGVFLRDLPVGALLEIQTKNRYYQLENMGDGKVLLAGHPKYCPSPVPVKINGSTWGRAMIKLQFIGRGMFLEFRHPRFGLIRTSRIQDVRELTAEALSDPQAYRSVC